MDGLEYQFPFGAKGLTFRGEGLVSGSAFDDIKMEDDWFPAPGATSISPWSGGTTG